MLRLQSPDALPHLVEPFVGAGARQPLVELGQGGLEAGGETLDDASFLLGPRLGVAVQAHLVGVGRDHLVQVHGLVGLGLERYGGLSVELTVRFAADDQIAVVVLTQPLHAGLGGDAAVHDHEGAGWRLQRLEHVGQRALFADVAGEDLGATHEAAGVEHQAQGQQRTVAALLLRVPALRLRLLARLALEVGVGQVVEGHRRLAVEQPHRAVEQMRLDRLAMLHQRVRGAVELHRADGLEVDAEQLAEAAARLQPAVRRALRGGLGETPTMTPAAAARRAPLTPNSASRAGRPNCSSAHRPSCSTPTLRGRSRRSESTSTRCTSVGPAAVPSPGAPRASNCAAMRWASCSTAGGPSAIRGAWPVKMSSMRAHNGGHWAWGMSKWRPRLSRVRCRTVFRRARIAPGDGRSRVFRPGSAGVWVRRMNTLPTITGRGGRSQPILYDYGTTSRTIKPVP